MQSRNMQYAMHTGHSRRYVPIINNKLCSNCWVLSDWRKEVVARSTNRVFNVKIVPQVLYKYTIGIQFLVYSDWV